MKVEEVEDSDCIMQFENVQLVDRSNPKVKLNGILGLKSNFMFFKDNESKNYLSVLYSLISSVEKQPLNVQGCPIMIRCKHFLNCQFIISKEKDAFSIYKTLLQHSRPTKIEELLCFKENNHLKILKAPEQSINKRMFEMESEYLRMGVPNNEWTVTDINYNYEICDTYSRVLYVPNGTSQFVLQASANFRSRGRLPVLSYLHPNGASICRCSQPLSGFSSRSIEDEQLFQNILYTNKNSTHMYVVDTRPKINAMANKAQGKGYENENNYSNIQFHFIGIENIHVMRNSLNRLLEACDLSNTTSFFSNLEKSEWLKHIKAVIDTSIFIANAIESNVNVVVHCSDGWDRTAQTCALSSLMLDPYFRTIHGFQILIEKEWLMFGHKFNDRCGHLTEDESGNKETSPIFQQFLECVWQLTQQFPCAFEFNEKFLIQLHEHAYSCQFGTFIGNNPKERSELKISERTYSLWEYIQYKINNFINPLYVPNSAYSRQVLKPDTRIQSIRFWKGLYNRFDACINPAENLQDSLFLLKSNTTHLSNVTRALEKKCANLKSLIENKKKAKENNETTENEVSNDDSNSIEQLNKNFDRLDINSYSSTCFKSTRYNCKCQTAFDFAISKQNCTQCGDIVCEYCIDNGNYVSSQILNKQVLICDKCVNKNNNLKEAV